jgi:general secretion pathway protein L
VSRALAVGCVSLLIALMLTALSLRQSNVERMQQEVAEQRHQVDALERSRRELTDTQGASSYLARLKTAQPTLTALLAELSVCLGDDTSLEQLEVHDSGDVSLSGQSLRASALINRARDCHSLVDPRFQGVIQPDAQTAKERFSLVAQLKSLDLLKPLEPLEKTSQEPSDAPPSNPQ